MPEYYRYGSGQGLPDNRKKKKKKVWRSRILTLAGVLAVAAGLFFGVRAAYRGIRNWVDSVMGETAESTKNSSQEAVSAESTETVTQTDDGSVLYTEELGKAAVLAASYDYDGAVSFLQSVEGYADVPALTKAIQSYLGQKAALVKADYTQICHVCFSSLAADPERAYKGGSESNNKYYNQSTATADEFGAVLTQLYEKGYVLVRLHDLAAPDAEGKLARGSIMLPSGKKALVLSVDDVCYHEAQEGAGFASRIVLNDKNEPVCEMKKADGSLVTGDYDVIPILEKFIAAHPDFSYKGARGIVGLTGYDGILGYRTAPKYGDPASPDYKPSYASVNVEEEKKQAQAVAARLKELGWEFACESWGRINLGSAGMDRIRPDMEKWLAEVDPLLGGGTDILIFPYGADIGNWRNYSQENEKFVYLRSCGFYYYCNMDSYNIPWVQYNASQNYLRQGRVELDGYAFAHQQEKISIFVDGAKILDPKRPPVPGN